MADKRNSVQHEVESILAKTPFGRHGAEESEPCAKEEPSADASATTEVEGVSTARMDRLDKKLDQMELRLNELRVRTIQDLKSQRQDFRLQIEGELSQNTTKISALEAEIEKLAGSLEAAKKADQDREKQILALIQDIASKPDAASLVKESKSSLLDILDSQKDRLKAVEDRLLEMVVSLDGTKNTVSKQVSDLSKEFDDRDRVHLDMQGQIDDLSGVVAEQANEYRNLLEQYQTENGEMANALQATLLGQLAEFQETVQASKAELENEFAEQLDLLRQDLSQVEDQVGQTVPQLEEILAQSTSQLEDRVAQSMSQIEESWTQKNAEDSLRIEQVNEEIGTQKCSISELQTLCRQVEVQATEAVAEIAALKEWLEKDIAGSINERLAFLESDIEDFRQASEVTNSQSVEEKEALRNQTAMLKMEIETQQKQLAQILDRVNAAESSLQIYTALTTEFEARVTSDKAKLSKVEEQVESIEQNLSDIREAESLFSEELALVKEESKRKDVRKDLLSPSDYFVFEERFRGSEQEIKQRQSRFVPYFKGCSHVLDIGCGRGEFLQLLQEGGIGSSGIDNNPVMVEYCQRRGLKVAEADAFSFLQTVEDSKLDGVYCGQLIEHFTAEEQIAFVKLVYKKMRFNSYFIIETMNPLNLPTSATHFYTDLSHKRPITPDAFSFLLAAVGFRKIDFDSLSDTPQEEKLQQVELPKKASASNRHMADTLNRNIDKINRLLFAYRDLAAIALK